MKSDISFFLFFFFYWSHTEVNISNSLAVENKEVSSRHCSLEEEEDRKCFIKIEPRNILVAGHEFTARQPTDLQHILPI